MAAAHTGHRARHLSLLARPPFAFLRGCFFQTSSVNPPRLAAILGVVLAIMGGPVAVSIGGCLLGSGRRIREKRFGRDRERAVHSAVFSLTSFRTFSGSL